MSSQSIAAAPIAPSVVARPWRHRLACAMTALLMGLAQGLGLQLVSANLSSIQGSIGATAAEASWLTTAYFATALSSTLLLAKFRVQFGIRLFASLGAWACLAAAALHIATNSLGSAVVARAAFGFASAPLSALAVLYMLEVFPPRLAAFGLILGFATLQLGQPLARIISPDLLEHGQWHGLFLFEVALAALSLAAIHAVRLTPIPRVQTFSRGDLLAFPLYAGGLALLSVVVSQGRLAWWFDTPWIGECLAASIACLAAYMVVDLNRERPLLNLRWLARPYMIRFVVAVLLFRIVLSEQTIGIVGLMTGLGQSNEQMEQMFAFAALGTVVGFGVSIVMLALNAGRLLSLLSTALIGLAAWHDADATALTRPDDLLVTQTLIAGGLSAYFSAACLHGFGPVMADGAKQLITFVAAFSGAQYLGSLLGSAWIATLAAQRQQWHYAALVQHLVTSDPQVATRIAQLSGSVAAVVNDPAARSLQGASLLAQQVSRESLVLAYEDVFTAIAWVCLGMFAWLAFLATRAWLQERAISAAVAARNSATH